MAAIYDPQGNIIGDDGGPTLDQMNLELSKQNRLTPQQMEKFVAPQSLASQIPGYGKPVPPSQTPPDPLGSAAGNFTELATKFNPLMMAKSMREAAGIVTVPAVAAVKGVGESLLTSPPGTYMSGKAPDYAEKVAKQFMQQNAPQTPMAQEFAGAVAPLMADLPAYLGHLQTGRPAFTPNDLRVMGAEATRVGRQVKDIPTDFVNAQSGMQRLDPITGQPTYGAKLQGVADSVGDIMAQREMQGLPPIPGLPASMQPMNPKLYAMRPAGSRIMSATMPATAKPDAATYAPAQEIINNVIDSSTITPVQALDEIQNKILRAPETETARNAFAEFLQQKASEMYPDAPSTGAALAAYKARFSDREASAAHTLGVYDEFLQTPEGIQFRAQHDLPSADELPARHEAAANWLNSQFTNYINEKVGTPDEPAAKLARQGLTFMAPNDVYDSASLSGNDIGVKRTAAGMPAKTTTDVALTAADNKLMTLRQQAIDTANRAIDQQTAGYQLGYGAIDPNTGRVVEGMNIGRYEPFAKASQIADKANAAFLKQQQEVDNLRLGAAYENATDIAVNANTAKDLKEELEYAERQFYPSLMKTPDDAQVYTASVRQLKNLGFDDIARNFYNDVMSGKIHLDKVPKMTVENYIRGTAEARVAKEKIEQLEQAKRKAAVDKQFKLSAETNIPNNKVFGNVGALEITSAMPRLKVAKLVSEDTTALDHCIGEGGTARNTLNPWHPGTGNRTYEPTYDVATGERNPKAPSPRNAYVNSVEKGAQMVSFRDIETGVPIATFQLNKEYDAPGTFTIGFAAGHRNQQVAPQYVEGITRYLNSRPDITLSTGSDLQKNLGIFERDQTKMSTLAQAVNMTRSEFSNYDMSGLPRFFTSSDIRSYVDAIKANAPQESAPAVLSQRPSESLLASTSGAVASSIDNILDSQRRAFDEAGESNQFVQAETFFSDTLDHFNRYAQAEGPVRALDRATQRLYDLENEYSNSPRIVANIIADGMLDLMQTLGLQAEYVNARIAAEEAQQPRAVAQRRELDDEQRPDYLRMTHDAALAADRQWGVQTADEVRAALRFIAEGQGAIDGPIDPAQNTEAYIRALRQQADAAVQGSADIVLNELADQMESAYLRDFEPEVAAPRPADLDNQRNDRIFQLENAVNDPELNPDDLRFLANELSNPLNQAANNHWISLAETERRDYAQALRQRANYIEFNPRDLAQRIIGEEEPQHHVDALTLLENNDYDHEVLRGLAPTERARAAQATALEMQRLLEGQGQEGIGQIDQPVDPDRLNALYSNYVDDYRRMVDNGEITEEWQPAELADFIRGDDEIGTANPTQAERNALADLVAAYGFDQHSAAAQIDQLAQNAHAQRLRALNVNGAPAREANAPAQQNAQPFDFTGMIDSVMGDMSAALPEPVVERVSTIAYRVSEQVSPRLDPVGYAEALRRVNPANEHVAVINALNDLADRVVQAGQPANPVANAVARRPAQVYMNAAHEIADLLNESEYSEYATGEVAAQQIDNHLRDLQRGGAVAFEDLLGIASVGYDWSTGLMQALELVLGDLATRYRLRGVDNDEAPGDANGGPVRGYQKGGTVKKPDVPTPYLFSVPTYSETVAYEMYPGQKGQDDQRDAARHMLAAGTLSRKYGPKTAEFLGKAHEFTTSPLQAIKSAFGGKMPADYGMDTHNNRFGAQLGQRAKSQAELEDLVQEEAERASRTQTQDKAFIKKANGGIVQQNPTTDQMRYALMMRRK
jgi:hypothetical protein